MQFNLYKLKRERVLKGLSMTTLGRMTGFTPQMIWYIEKKGSQSPQTIKRLADALGLTMEELIIEEEVIAAR